MPGEKQRRKYRIDERTPPELRRKLLAHLHNATNPEKLEPYLNCRFGLDGDFFVYTEDKGPMKRTTSIPDTTPDVYRLKNEYGERIFTSLQDFKERREVIEKMLDKLNVQNGNRTVAINVYETLFQIYPGKPIVFSLRDNAGRIALERFEIEIRIMISMTSFSTFYVTSRGIYNPSALFLPESPDTHKLYRVPFIPFEKLEDEIKGKLLNLKSINPFYTLVINPNPPPRICLELKPAFKGKKIPALPSDASLQDVRQFGD